MAGFWAGFGQGFSDGLDRVERRRQFNETLEFKRKQAAVGALGNLGATRTKKDSFVSQAAALKGFGLEDDVVSRIIGTGDATNITQLVSDLRNGYTKAAEVGRGEQYLETAKVTLSNATMTPQSEVELSAEDLRESLGGVADELITDEFSTTVTQPGSLSYRPPIYTETANITDQTKTEDRIVENSLITARNENRKVNQAITAITQELETANPSDEREAQLREDLGVLTTRSQTVGEAIDAYTGESKDAYALLSIFGNSAAQDILSENPTVRPESLLPNYREAISSSPMVVTSEDQIRRFLQLGILKEGDSVVLNGTVRPLTRRN